MKYLYQNIYQFRLLFKSLHFSLYRTCIIIKSMVFKKLRKEEVEEEIREEQTCLRCGWTWIPFVNTPKNCPQCKSTGWNKKRIRNIREERRAKDRSRSSSLFSPTHPSQKGDER